MRKNYLQEIARDIRGQGLTKELVNLSNSGELAELLKAKRDGHEIVINKVRKGIEFPSSVKKFQHPDLRIDKVCDPGKVTICNHSLELRDTDVNLAWVHSLLESRRDLVKTISGGHLQWEADNPEELPPECFDGCLILVAWTDVFETKSGGFKVPVIDCAQMFNPILKFISLETPWGPKMRTVFVE